MGTNYYVIDKPCECCGRSGQELHIGKSSHGWKFLFEAHEELGLCNFEAWREKILSEDIFVKDENGDIISPKWLLSLIESKQDLKSNTDCIDHNGYRINSYEFVLGEFC